MSIAVERDAIIGTGTHTVGRFLQLPGEVVVEVGASVTPEEVVARSEEVEQTFTLFVANELGVEPDSIRKYLSKSIGSELNEGEVVARVRRGLRTSSVKSPVTGTLVSADETSGTVTMTANVGTKDLQALMHGEVSEVVQGRGVLIGAPGTRITGAFGVGADVHGKLVVGIDRPDRELTVDQISADWKGCIVLAGMTAGVPALNRLREVGVVGLIIGGIGESDVRRFVAGGASDASALVFWGDTLRPHPRLSRADDSPPPAILATEGFGRLPMSEPIFRTLRELEGSHATLLQSYEKDKASVARPILLVQPEQTDEAPAEVPTSRYKRVEAGSTVRLTEPSRPALFGSCVSEPRLSIGPDGASQPVVDVELSDGTLRTGVSIANIEVLS